MGGCAVFDWLLLGAVLRVYRFKGGKVAMGFDTWEVCGVNFFGIFYLDHCSHNAM